MASSTSPVQPAAAEFLSLWRVDFAPTAAKPAPHAPSTVEQAVEAQHAEQKAETLNALLPGQLLVEIDRASGRFVHTLMDSQTQEVLLRFPNEGQLAFSRAIAAYARARAND